MIATVLVVSTILLAQAQTPAPKADDALGSKVLSPAEVAKLSPADRAQYERARLVAKRKVERQKKAEAQAARRARAAQDEAKLRDYEMKMAPIIAAQQVEMARLQVQEQQAALNRQAVSNAQQYQAARLAQENDRLMLDYWRSQQPIQVIIKK